MGVLFFILLIILLAASAVVVYKGAEVHELKKMRAAFEDRRTKIQKLLIDLPHRFHGAVVPVPGIDRNVSRPAVHHTQDALPHFLLRAVEGGQIDNGAADAHRHGGGLDVEGFVFIQLLLYVQ